MQAFTMLSSKDCPGIGNSTIIIRLVADNGFLIRNSNNNSKAKTLLLEIIFNKIVYNYIFHHDFSISELPVADYQSSWL